MKLRPNPFILIGVVAVTLSFGKYSIGSMVTTEGFKDYISEISAAVAYREVIPFHGETKGEGPGHITKAQAVVDIQMIEYLLNTSYSGLEYWEHHGVGFKGYFSHLRDFVSRQDTIRTAEFEGEVSEILKQINDGHIAIIGSKYNWAYRHKSVYFCDVLVEKADSGVFEVIDSKLDAVRIGDLFTQKDGEKHLFRTLSSPNRSHYLVGALSYAATASRRLSFNNEMIRIPFHKSRLMYARPLDPGPVHVGRESNIPIVRVSSFADEEYAHMRRFMELGHELRDEKKIVLDLSHNGGGSSIFPQTFIKNLNNLSEWEITWAILSSPAIAQYFAKYDLASMPDIPPGFRQAILSNRVKLEEQRKKPVRSWEFGETRSKEPYGDYGGTLVMLTNRRVLSAAEAMVGYSRSLRNRIVIGENTAGVAQFSDAQQYVLPNSELIIKLPRQILLIPDFEEGIGYLPDYWLDSMEPMKEILRWLNSPDDYQFRFSSSYSEMLKQHDLSPPLPADATVIPPSSQVSSALRAYSGKWSGIADGILDTVLVVERINDSLEVDAVYSWGVAYQWGINQPGWQRYRGKIRNQKLLLTSEDSEIIITYECISDNTLEQTYKRPGVLTHTTLSRMAVTDLLDPR